MKRYVIFALCTFILVASSPVYAEADKGRGQQQKDAWKDQWQGQNPPDADDDEKGIVGTIRDKYNKDGAAWREKAGKVGVDLLQSVDTPEERAKKLEAVKGVAQGMAEKWEETEDKRAKRIEIWRSIKEKADGYEDRQKLKDWAYHNRDTPHNLKQSYQQWKQRGGAEKLNTYIQQWRGTEAK